MTTFKIKHDKNKAMVHVSTLDETHKKIMGDFEKKRNSLPSKMKKLNAIQKQLEKLEKLNPTEYSTTDIKKRAELKTEIITLKDEIYDIENDVSELEYYYKTEDIIMDYYQIMEMGDHDLYEQHPELREMKKDTDKKKELDRLEILNRKNLDKKKKNRVAKKRKRTRPEQNVSILDFMGNVSVQVATNVVTDTETETEFETETMEDTEVAVIPEVIEQNNVLNKATLLDQYMMLIDNNYLSQKSKDNIIKTCNNCNIEKTLIHAEGIYVCHKCGEAEMVIIDSEKPNYKESISDNKPSYPYKKGNHLSRAPKRQCLLCSISSQMTLSVIKIFLF